MAVMAVPLQLQTRTFMGGFYYKNSTRYTLASTNTLPVGTQFYFSVKSEYYTTQGWLPWAYQKVQLLKDGAVLAEGYTNDDGWVWFPTTFGETYSVEEGTHEYVAVTVAGPNNTESRSSPIIITGQAVTPPTPPPPTPGIWEWLMQNWKILAVVGALAVAGIGVAIALKKK
jgi:hypothetical protein